MKIKFSKNRIMYIILDEDNIYFLHVCRKQKGKAEKFEKMATTIPLALDSGLR